MPRDYWQPQTRRAMGAPAYDIEYGEDIMDWGVQTDNLPAYQAPPQMPSPQRRQRGGRVAGSQPGFAPIDEPQMATTIDESGYDELGYTATPLGGGAGRGGIGPSPTLGEPPEMELPAPFEPPEMQMPTAPDYPEFEAPGRPSETKYVQEAAAPGVRALRRATTEALASADFAKNPIVQSTIREQVLRGHGDALSQVMGMARTTGGEKAERIYRGRFESAKINYQTDVMGIKDDYQTSVMKAQTDWQGVMQGLLADYQAGTIKSQAEYQAALDKWRLNWTTKLQNYQNKYKSGTSMAQGKFSGEINNTLDEIERSYLGYREQNSTTNMMMPSPLSPSRASGGPVRPTYEVGERGPELVKYDNGGFELVGKTGPEIRTFAKKGTVIPAGKTNTMLKSMHTPQSRQGGGRVKGSKMPDRRWLPSRYAEMAGFVPRGSWMLSRSMVIMQSDWEKEQERQNRLALALAGARGGAAAKPRPKESRFSFVPTGKTC